MSRAAVCEVETEVRIPRTDETIPNACLVAEGRMGPDAESVATICFPESAGCWAPAVAPQLPSARPRMPLVATMVPILRVRLCNRVIATSARECRRARLRLQPAL